LLKIDFFSIIFSDVTVPVGCSNELCCCEVWCSRRGGWWRGRPTNRLDRHADWTDRLRTWLATRHLLSHEMKLCRLVIWQTLYDRHISAPRRAAMPANLPLPSPTSETDLSQEHSFSRRECGGGRERASCSTQQVCNDMHITASSALDNADNAATQRQWGRGGEHSVLSSRQSAITPTSQ